MYLVGTETEGDASVTDVAGVSSSETGEEGLGDLESDGRHSSCFEGGHRWQWRGGALLTVAVDLGQDCAEFGEDDDGEVTMVRMRK